MGEGRASGLKSLWSCSLGQTSHSGEVWSPVWRSLCFSLPFSGLSSPPVPRTCYEGLFPQVGLWRMPGSNRFLLWPLEPMLSPRDPNAESCVPESLSPWGSGLPRRPGLAPEGRSGSNQDTPFPELIAHSQTQQPSLTPGTLSNFLYYCLPSNHLLLLYWPVLTGSQVLVTSFTCALKASSMAGETLAPFCCPVSKANQTPVTHHQVQPEV